MQRSNLRLRSRECTRQTNLRFISERRLERLFCVGTRKRITLQAQIRRAHAWGASLACVCYVAYADTRNGETPVEVFRLRYDDST